MSVEYSDEKGVVARIRKRFADDANRTDAWLLERGWDDPGNSPHIWVEAFADRTTEAARAGDWSSVRDQTEFLATEFRNGSEAVRKLVDVSYAENLMWDLDDGIKNITWPNIAKEVRELYEQIWGIDEWMKPT